ncbi:MAG: hypothetical protein K6G04_02945 [Lachnospiraceae bacterium]|nr:hypothetical protein [Lachnospiraceae bacterium]
MKYEVSSLWEPYYEELDTTKRKELLDSITASNPDDGANEFRRRVFQYRYVDEKNPKHQIDRFLWIACMLRDICNNTSLFSMFSKKQVISYGNELGFDQIAGLSELEKTCLYQEYRHALRRYYASCMSGNYHSMFGILQPEDEVRIAAAKQDIEAMTSLIAQRFHVEENFALWMEAGASVQEHPNI